MESGKKKGMYVLGALLLLFFLWMAAQIPYVHDDWNWGSPIGLEWLRHGTVNSRYAGNLLVVLLTRSKGLKTLVMGLCFFLLPLLAVPVVIDRKRSSPGEGFALALLSVALFTGIPWEVWNQTNGWVSGFANYSFSALVLLGLLWLVRDIWEERETRLPHAAACLLLGFAVQLFLENLAVYVLALALCLFALCLLRKKRPSLSASALLLGAGLGALLMFSSEIYGGLLTTGQAIGTYRRLIVDFDAGLLPMLFQVIYNFLAIILPDLYGGLSWAYSVVLLAILILLLTVRRREWKKPVYVLLQLGNGALLLYYLGQHFGLDARLFGGDTRYMAIVRLGCGLLLFGLTAYQLFRAEKDRKRTVFVLGLWLSVPLVLLPMSVVNMTGPRAFFSSICFYILVILAAVELLLRHTGKRERNCLTALAGAALLLVCLRLGVAYEEVGRINRERERLLAGAREQGLQELVLPDYPDKDLLWLPNGVEMYSFRSFYGLDPDITIRIE